MDTINFILPAHLAEAFGWTLLHSLWQAVAIAFLAAVALIALRNKPAILRYRVANFALAGILTAAVITFYFYYGPVPASQQAAVAFHETPSMQAIEKQAMPGITQPFGILDSNTWRDYFSRHLPLIATLWFLGMSIFLLRLMGNFAYVHYLKTHLVFPVESYWEETLERLVKRTGVRKSIQLAESALVQTPLMVGWLKPLILFPIGMINRLDHKEVEAILAHELAHILHHDYLLNFLQSFVETLFYFHPAVWWLSAKTRQEREMAADDAAIRLTGDSVAFAKTLVLVQEMSFARRPGNAAFAFAGNRKSQFFHRIQRILNIKSPKNFNMEKLVGTLAVVLVLFGLGYSQSRNAGTSEKNLSQAVEVTGDGFSGVWQAEVKDGKVCISLTSRREQGSWMSSDCFPTSEFSALPTTEGEFTMTRPAGVIAFTGKFEKNEGYGKFKFSPDQPFAGWLGQQGITGVDDQVMFHLFFAKTDKAYVTSLKQSGYGSISGEDLTQLAIHEVNAEKIKAYHQLSERLGDGKPSIDKMVELSIHEITPEYAQALEKIGFKNMSLDDVVSYKIHEVTPEYVQQVNALGFKNLSPEDVMSFKIHEITAEYLQSLKQAGLTNLSAEDVLSMKIHDVSPQKVEALKKMGFTNLSNDDILNMQIHEIEPEFLAEMGRLGFKNLSADDAMNLKIHDVDANYVAELKKAGFSNLSMDEVVTCKIHELDAAFVADLKRGGFDNLTVEEALNCKIHEVSPAQLKAFEQLGFKNISVDDAINLRIHEVTPEFISKMRDKGFKDMSLDEYINLKIQYGDKMK